MLVVYVRSVVMLVPQLSVPVRMRMLADNWRAVNVTMVSIVVNVGMIVLSRGMLMGVTVPLCDV